MWQTKDASAGIDTGQLLGQDALTDEGAMQGRHIVHVIGYHKHAHHRPHRI